MDTTSYAFVKDTDKIGLQLRKNDENPYVALSLEGKSETVLFLSLDKTRELGSIIQSVKELKTKAKDTK